MNLKHFGYRPSVYTYSNYVEAIEVCGIFENGTDGNVTWGTHWRQQFAIPGAELTCDYVSRIDGSSYSMTSPGFFCACNTSAFSATTLAVAQQPLVYQQVSLLNGTSDPSQGGYGQLPSAHLMGQKMSPINTGSESANFISGEHASMSRGSISIIIL